MAARAGPPLPIPDDKSQGLSDKAVAGVAAQETAHHLAVDLRDIARRFSTEQHANLQRLMTSYEEVRDASGLVVTSGKPLSVFEPAVWPSCFVEFMYGDAVPNLERPRALQFAELFSALVRREELAYDVPGDKQRFEPRARSRFDSPEMVAVFADVVRRLKVLTDIKGSFQAQGFAKDIKMIAACEPAKIAAAAEKVGDGQGVQSALAQKDLDPNVRVALRRLLSATANIPLTEGYKVKARHIGNAMNLMWGPLVLFCTCNFADTYHPIMLSLGHSVDGTVLAERPVRLSDEEPEMPSLRQMHMLGAASPCAQARFFMLMTELVEIHLLGLEETRTVRGRPALPREDAFASSGQPGLAGFASASLMPLEAQGRGFTHGHRKVHAVPSWSAARLRRLLEGSDSEAVAAFDIFQEALVRAASTVQYDSATLPARQLNQSVPPEPFTTRQQAVSRMDGGPEADGKRRSLVQLREAPAWEHIEREKRVAAAEGRPPQHSFRAVPLTGGQLSILPLYRLPQGFGRQAMLDEDGVPTEHGRAMCLPRSESVCSHRMSNVRLPPCALPTESGAGSSQLARASTTAMVGKLYSENSLDEIRLPWVSSDDGCVTALRNPTGARATPAEIRQDAKDWALNFARDVRVLQCGTQMHECTATCQKNVKKVTNVEGKDQKIPPPTCRFHFYHDVKLVIQARRGVGKGVEKGEWLWGELGRRAGT